MRSLVLNLFICLFVILLSGCSDAGQGGPESVIVGGQSPDFALTALDGTTMKSNSLKGGPVVLNFWATWCQPCMSEIPELKQVAANSKVRVVGIALDQDGANVVKSFVEANKINYTVLLGDEDVFQRFNGVGIPYTLLLDQSQRIVKIYRGPVTKESLEADLKAIQQST